MTVEELVYDYFFPEGNRKSRRDILFKLAKCGTDISKKENVKFLYRGCNVQPDFLYDKQVIKFWVEIQSTDNYIIWVLYE